MAARVRQSIIITALGIAGATLVGCINSAMAQAAPHLSPVEEMYVLDALKYVPPSLPTERVLELGNLTCSVRRAGQSTDDAKVAVSRNLNATGVNFSNAVIGSLVHVAIDDLCPEVGYP